jgi:hypothetical protein
MDVIFRPLGKVREIVQWTGLDISYAYDDLVFGDHSLFIIQFDDTRERHLKLYFNVDCARPESFKLEQQLLAASQAEGFVMTCSGSFAVNQEEGQESINLKFFEAATATSIH